MGKKRSRTSQTSAGIIGNAYKHASKALRKEYRQSIERSSNQLKAFYKGRRVILTIPNPNTNETNKPFIKVNARDVWSGGGKEKKR
tara:strand:+ start:4223 stop:4480 length:258 start_codon:yes stop_codon:yes gene_type:complete